jgi:hypothetical protein
MPLDFPNDLYPNVLDHRCQAISTGDDRRPVEKDSRFMPTASLEGEPLLLVTSKAPARSQPS